MKKYLFIALAILAALVWMQTARLQQVKADRSRLSQNQIALMSDLVRYRNAAGDSTVSNQVLRLKCAEFEELRAADAEYIRGLGVKIKRLESASKTATATIISLRAALRDTIVLRPVPDPSAPTHADSSTASASHPLIPDTLRTFRWRDAWVTVSGLIDRDSVTCRVTSVDTLRQIIHRIPRRFLFIRWGTKSIRQEITSSNPHTRIVYTEAVQFEK